MSETTRLPVLHSCGCEVLHDIGGKPSTRAWQAKQRGKGPCPDCRLRQWQTETAVDNATYAAEAAEHALPELTGSPKQVPWATTIRGKLLDDLPGKLAELNRHADARGHDRLVATASAFALIREVVLFETSAEWWITNRQTIGVVLVRKHAAQFRMCGDAGDTARRLLMWAGLRPKPR